MNEHDNKTSTGLAVNGGIGNDNSAVANNSALSFEELEPVIAPATDIFLKVD